MSYRCDSCKKIVDPHISKAKYQRVTETRPRTYYNESNVHYFVDNKQYVRKEMVASVGTEIVKVTNFCPMEAKFFDATHLTNKSEFAVDGIHRD